MSVHCYNVILIFILLVPAIETSKGFRLVQSQGTLLNSINTELLNITEFGLHHTKLVKICSLCSCRMDSDNASLFL